MVFSAELSTAVLFVDVFFDRSNLRVEVSLAVSVVVEIRDGVRLLVGKVGASTEGLFGSGYLAPVH